MQTSLLMIVAVLLVVAAYWVGIKRSFAIGAGIGGVRHLHSLPGYHGLMLSLWCGLPMLVFLAIWLSFEQQIVTQIILQDLPAEFAQLAAGEISLKINEVKLIALGLDTDPSHASMLVAAEHYTQLSFIAGAAKFVLAVALALAGIAYGYFKISVELKAREHFETLLRWFFILSSLIAIFTTFAIVLSVLSESIRFFRAISIFEFLFSTHWSPQVALRADQAGSSGAFGAVPLFAGTFLISIIALCLAVPVGLMSAIYLAEYASAKVRNVIKPLLEVLAGIPTVVYGFFAALTAGPFIRDVAHALGFQSAAAESALAAGLVMGVMIIPFISSLSDDIIKAVPDSLRDGSLGLGATKSETIAKVVIPAALPGIVGGILLAASRALGETMIVVMAAGLAANLTANPLESVTTVTVQIVTLLTGDQEFDSPKTLAAFALGLMLFVTTLALNFIALNIVKKYREQYD